LTLTDRIFISNRCGSFSHEFFARRWCMRAGEKWATMRRGVSERVRACPERMKRDLFCCGSARREDDATNGAMQFSPNRWSRKLFRCLEPSSYAEPQQWAASTPISYHLWFEIRDGKCWRVKESWNSARPCHFFPPRENGCIATLSGG